MSSNRLTGYVVRRDHLDRDATDRLFGLFTTHYTHVEREVFDHDLEAKDWVLLLEDETGQFRGFTTLVVYDLEVMGRRVRAAFNGNTVIDHDCWGQQELVRIWTRFMAERKAEAPEVPFYWYLISSGYRTYMYLPLFYREFYPRYDRPTPEFHRRLIDKLGRSKFPGEYHDGVIHVARARECLRGDLAEVPEHKRRKPHVRFFLESNPGYRRGDELACAAEFRLENIRGFPHEIARQVLAP